MEHAYHQFTVRDFVLDDAFRRWVFEPDERSITFWHTFRLRHPEQQTTIDEAASLLLHLRTSYDDLTDASQQRIGQMLERAALAKGLGEPQRTNPRTWTFGWQPRRLGWRAAASLTGVLLLGGVGWYASQPKQQRIHTAFGQHRRVTLPDGSEVLLNGNSTLTFAGTWAAGEPREVWLDGEAFFSVTRQKQAAGRVKFTTHTPGLDITVLGTRYNVSTRRGSTAVTLVEGKVRLSKPGALRSRVIEMKPGQHAATRPSTEEVAVRSAKPALHTAWVQHQFAFDNTTLGDIAQQLRDSHGLDIVFEDATLANRRFTGNLSNENMETLLTTLALTFNLTVQRDGNRVVLQQRL